MRRAMSTARKSASGSWRGTSSSSGAGAGRKLTQSFNYCLQPGAYHPARLAQNHFRGGDGDRPAEKAVPAAVLLAAVRPFGELLGGRRMADVARAAPDDKTEHHLVALGFHAHPVGHRLAHG